MSRAGPETVGKQRRFLHYCFFTHFYLESREMEHVLTEKDWTVCVFPVLRPDCRMFLCLTQCIQATETLV